jgi:outer membrane beta-barrel protein
MRANLAPTQFVIFTALFFSTLTLAQTKKANTPAPNASAESAATKVAKDKGAVDFNAKDVWNVDIFDREDHKVLVIQERKYNKAGRLELGLDVGSLSASPFYKTYTYGAHVTYHLSEYFGIEGFASNSSSSLTADGKQIENFLEVFDFPSKKEFKRPKFFGGIGAVWSPIYGKFAFFRSNIIHFDLYGQAGLSLLTTATNVKSTGGTDQTHIGSLLGVGMRVFLNESWIWRFDMKNNIYRADFAAVSNNTNSTPASTLTLSNFHFGTSISMLFNLGGF